MDNNIGDARRAYADKVGGFTQEDAAEYFGVALSTYKKWEQGQGKMNGAQLRAIAEKYEVSTDYLLRRTSVAAQAASKDGVRLPSAERELLALYRSMSAQGKARLMEQAEFLATRHPLNQAHSLGA